jgi:hypothetical protein
MPFVKLDENEAVIGYATSPPSAEAEEWIEVSEDDPAVVEFLNSVTPSPPDFAGLLNAMRGTAEFSHAYTAADESIAALNALTLLLSSLSSTHNLDDLRFSFNRLRAVMPSTAVGDYSEAELEAIAQRLQDNGFPLTGFNLEA